MHGRLTRLPPTPPRSLPHLLPAHFRHAPRRIRAPHPFRAFRLLGAPRHSRASLTLRRPWLCRALLLVCLLGCAPAAEAKPARTPAGGRAAVVVDERLGALREAPGLGAGVLRRLGRGRVVALRGARAVRDGVTFYRVAVTSRTTGWVQAEAVVSASRAGDDARLLRLVRGSSDFDRVERAALFLETFPRSAHRPAVLLLLGESADEAAQRLTREAARRLDAREMEAGGAPAHSYFLNYSGLDRYRRRGVRFVFDPAARRFRYDGAAWRELLRRHPRSPEAEQVRQKGKASDG